MFYGPIVCLADSDVPLGSFEVVTVCMITYGHTTIVVISIQFCD